METNERIIAAIMKYWVLMANEVLMMAIAAKVARAIDPAILNPLIDTSKFRKALKLSANPTKYKAILSAVAIQSVMPMAPPIGRPRLRDKT